MFELSTWPRDPWSVFGEYGSLRDELSRFLADGAGDGRREMPWRGPGNRLAYPPMNIWSSENGLIIDAELPGVDPANVDIAVMGDEITVRGNASPRPAPEQEVWHREERPSGEFERTLQLPFKAEPGAVKANYKNGILRLTVPRSERERPRKIAVEAS